MQILPIRTKADYRRTLKEIETLMDAAPKSQKGSGSTSSSRWSRFMNESYGKKLIQLQRAKA